MAANSRNIPHFITASTPQGLMRKMLQTNLKDSMEHNYFSIVKDSNKWLAWYYKIIDIKIVTSKDENKNIIVEAQLGEEK